MFNTHHEISDMEIERRQDQMNYRRLDARVKRIKRGALKGFVEPNLLAKLSFGLIQWGGHSHKE